MLNGVANSHAVSIGDDAAMFAPKIAKPPKSNAREPAGKVMPRLASGSRSFSSGMVEHAIIGEKPRVSWDLSKISSLPPDQLYETRSPGVIQAKLAVGAAHDSLEDDADRVADRVMCDRLDSAPPWGVAQPLRRGLQVPGAGCNDSVANAPAIVLDVVNSGGRPLDSATRSFMEPRLGHAFDSVQIHNGPLADASARAVDALAYTVGSHVVFADAAPSRATAAGQRLLAHELTHVVQQAAAPTPWVGRFASPEHRDLGDAGSGHAQTDVDIGGHFLSYGEMVALAGDYFGSLAEVRSLALTPDGRDQLKWARWKALNIGAEPAVAEAVKTAVMNRYFSLAAQNISHFSAGGTALREYENGHIDALQKAFNAGSQNDSKQWDQAVTAEAFCNHFLTDMFSAGHVRTERAAIKTWYQSHYPNSIDQFVADIAHFIYGELPVYKKPFTSETDIAKTITALGGPAMAAFSLGDIVSLAAHNRDNTGLDVISPSDETGKRDAHWKDLGDNQLSTSPKTSAMAIAAVKASLADLQTMRTMATGVTVGVMSSIFNSFLKKLMPFAAEQYIPRVDPASTTNAVLPWQWGSFNAEMRAAVDAAVRLEIVPTLRGKASAIADKDARAALLKYCTQLDSLATAAIEQAIHAKAGP